MKKTAINITLKGDYLIIRGGYANTETHESIKTAGVLSSMGYRQEASIGRAISSITGLVYANGFNQYATLSFACDEVQHNFGKVKSATEKLLARYKALRNKDLQYLALFERSSDDFWHVHIFACGILPQDLIPYTAETAATEDIRRRVEAGYPVYKWVFFDKRRTIAMDKFAAAGIMYVTLEGDPGPSGLSNRFAVMNYVLKFLRGVKKTLHEFSGLHWKLSSNNAAYTSEHIAEMKQRLDHLKQELNAVFSTIGSKQKLYSATRNLKRLPILASSIMDTAQVDDVLDTLDAEIVFRDSLTLCARVKIDGNALEMLDRLHGIDARLAIDASVRGGEYKSILRDDFHKLYAQKLTEKLE